jgi:hypothetical protein
MSSKSIVVALFVAGALATSTAGAQNRMFIRGTITAIDASTLSVKSRDGRDLTLALPVDASVAVATAASFEGLKEGDYVGTTTKQDADGNEVALEVHYLPPAANSGQTPADLVPNSKMTNANVSKKVVSAADRVLMLQFPGATQKVIVPEGTPIVRAVPGARADLRPGEYVFVSASQTDDGKLTALRVQVGKDGVRPPM